MAQRTVAAPPAKPAMPPQVVYRIDDHRYFELTPEDDCYGDMVYFVDTVKGIRSQVVNFDPVMNRSTLIIDAANDQYLVAPVTRGNINCSSGGGGCGGNKMPYSTDGGKTWKRVWHPGWGDDLMVSGSTAYHSRRKGAFTKGLDLTIPPTSSDSKWNYLPDFLFKPRIAPVDTQVLCKAQKVGGAK